MTALKKSDGYVFFFELVYKLLLVGVERESAFLFSGRVWRGATHSGVTFIFEVAHRVNFNDGSLWASDADGEYRNR